MHDDNPLSLIVRHEAWMMTTHTHISSSLLSLDSQHKTGAPVIMEAQPQCMGPIAIRPLHVVQHVAGMAAIECVRKLYNQPRVLQFYYS